MARSRSVRIRFEPTAEVLGVLVVAAVVVAVVVAGVVAGVVTGVL